MKVSELIERLSAFNQDAEVTTGTNTTYRGLHVGMDAGEVSYRVWTMKDGLLLDEPETSVHIDWNGFRYQVNK